jgi:uncharacterized protein YndB with AHSA1/START domain
MPNPGESATVERIVDLPADPDAVWDALTTGEQLSQWLGDDVTIDAHPGGQVAVREHGRLRRAVIIDFEPARHLAFRWLPDRRPIGFVWPADDAPVGEGGEVSFTLEPLPWGTRLVVVETAPAELRASSGDDDIDVVTLPAAYVGALGRTRFALLVCA